MQRTSSLGLAALMSVCLISNISQASSNGIAVSVAYRWGTRDFMPLIPEANNEGMKGRICRFTIRNSQVVQCDTIFYGMGQYPAISWDGTRVAFFRLGVYRNTTGNILEGLTNPTTTRIGVGQTLKDTLYGSWNDVWVSLIEANGSIRNLVKLPSALGAENGLDWPVGDWIYYACPSSSAARPGEGQSVHRVNTITGVDELVASFPNEWIRRLTMTLDGTKFALQTYRGSGGLNSLLAIPSLEVTATAGGCNVSVSPTGAIVGHYMGGKHKEVWLLNDPNNRIPSLYDAVNWNPDICFTKMDADTIIGCEVIRWAVNSDKWFTQGMGWYGHASDNIKGGNSVLMNWIDHEALCVSNNLRVDGDAMRYGNCAGDFFLNDIPVGKVEDSAGVWRTMPNLPLRAASDTVRITVDSASANPASQLVALIFGTHATVAALSATSSASWLSAAVEGTGSGQGVRISASIAGLSMGSYYGWVTVSGGTLRAQFLVALRVNGVSKAVAIILTRDSLYAQANGIAQFTATLRDQFGQTVAGTVSWSVSGGGTISSSGLFTSSGALGTFGVTAQSGSLSKQGAIAVTSNKPLPLTGSLKELLCLETGAGSPYIPEADEVGIQTAYTGSSRRIPVDGQQITVGANTYIWKLRTDADGKWADVDSIEHFVAYWYTTLTSQSPITAQIVCTHDDEFWTWKDGLPLVHRPYPTGAREDWNAQFTINPAGTGLLLKLWEMYGGNKMSVRFVNPVNGQSLGGVQYSPPGDVTALKPPVKEARYRSVDAVRILNNRIYIGQPAGKSWSVHIASLNGAIIKSYAGTGDRQIALYMPRYATGVYVVKVVANGTTFVRRMMVR